MDAPNTSAALVTRFIAGLAGYCGTACASPSGAAAPSPGLRAEKTIQSRKIKYGDKTMPAHSIASLIAQAKMRKSGEPTPQS